MTSCCGHNYFKRFPSSTTPSAPCLLLFSFSNLFRPLSSSVIKYKINFISTCSSKHESKFPEVPSCTKASSAPNKCARCLGNEPEILFVPWGHVVIEWFAGLVAAICTSVSNVVFPS